MSLNFTGGVTAVGTNIRAPCGQEVRCRIQLAAPSSRTTLLRGRSESTRLFGLPQQTSVHLPVGRRIIYRRRLSICC